MTKFWIKVLPAFIRVRLEGRAGVQRVAVNVIWLFADRVVRLGVGLLVSVWVARYLGPQLFGVYNYAIAFVGLFGFVSTLGLDSIVIRDIVHAPQDAAEILGTTFALKLTGAAMTVIVSISTVSLLRTDDPALPLLVGLIAAGTLFQAFDAIDFWFQSQVQSKYTVYARNTAFLIISGIKVGLILLHAPLIAFVAASVAEVILGSFGLITAYRLTGHSIRRWRASLARARSLLSTSWPLMLTSIAVWVYMRIDQVMLGSLADDRVLGVYSAAVRLSEIWYFIPITIVNSVFPAIVRSKAINEQLYYDRLQRLFNLLVALSYAVCVPATLLAGPIINILYGPSYSEASTMFVVLMWAGLFAALGVARETWIVSEGLTRFSFATAVIGAIVNIVLNVIFIPHGGALAAAWATLAAQAVAVSFSTLLYARTRRVFVMQLKALTFRGGLRV
jgi:PST family polysaccharide transporter